MRIEIKVAIVAEGAALAVSVYVSDPVPAREMADRTLAEFGGIDYLVTTSRPSAA